MNILSLFGGIECWRVAIERLWIPVNKYFSSEIDPYAMKIASANYPDIIHIGNVTDISYTPIHEWWKTHTLNWEWHHYVIDIDLLIGGSPCQDLSIAKKNWKWLEWEKSGLFYEYVRILREVRPKYFLLENVASMKQADKEKITEDLREVYPDTQVHMINSALVSAQNRKRLYWTNIPWITQPEDKWIVLRDILEDIPMDDERWKPIPEKYITDDFKVRIREATKLWYVEPEVWDAVDMSQENSKTRRGRLMRGGGKSNALLTWNNIMVIWIREKSLAIQASYAKKNIQNYMEKSEWQVVLWTYQLPRWKNEWNIHSEKTPTLTTWDFPNNNKLVSSDGLVYMWRKLTPIECERLQTLPDWYTSHVSDSRRYKAIGNGWTVDVIAHILSFIS